MRILKLIVVLFLTICKFSSSNKVYERYEQLNNKDNSTQIIEIFRTKIRPPNHFDNEQKLDDFLSGNGVSRALNKQPESNFTTSTNRWSPWNRSNASLTSTTRVFNYANRTRFGNGKWYHISCSTCFVVAVIKHSHVFSKKDKMNVSQQNSLVTSTLSMRYCVCEWTDKRFDNNVKIESHTPPIWNWCSTQQLSYQIAE